MQTGKKKGRKERGGKERRTRVRIGKEGREGEDDFEDGEGGRPVMLQNVDADASALGDIHVIDPVSFHT